MYYEKTTNTTETILQQQEKDRNHRGGDSLHLLLVVAGPFVTISPTHDMFNVAAALTLILRTSVGPSDNNTN